MITEVLVYLIGGGSVVWMSWIAEQSAWFQALGSEAKKWLMFGGSALIGGLALAVNTYVPAEVLTQLQPWFAIVAYAFGYVFLNQLGHRVDTDRQ